MKPKRRVFCKDCGRLKMLFDSERSAQDFIKFNAEELVIRKRPHASVRAYWCESCGGWHVASTSFFAGGDNAQSEIDDTDKGRTADLTISNDSLYPRRRDVPPSARNFITKYRRSLESVEITWQKRAYLARNAWMEGERIKDFAELRYLDIPAKMEQMSPLIAKCLVSWADELTSDDEGCDINMASYTQFKDMCVFASGLGVDTTAIEASADSAVSRAMDELSACEGEIMHMRKNASKYAKLDRTIKWMNANIAVGCPSAAEMHARVARGQIEKLAVREGVSKEKIIGYIDSLMDGFRRIDALRDSSAENNELTIKKESV